MAAARRCVRCAPQTTPKSWRGGAFSLDGAECYADAYSKPGDFQ